MNNKIKSSLTKGLLTGYAGGKVNNVTRGNFVGKSSHVTLEDGEIYHDEWFANHSGGGQELVNVGGSLFTRLYAGGIIDEEKIKTLGTSVDEINKYLVNKISELGESTRLSLDCRPESDGQWQYEYKITGNYPDFNITTSLESIRYKGVNVHYHTFILCPII